MKFKNYVLLKEASTRTAAKTGLYPLGYGGIGNYPDAWWISAAADAFLYITQDKRLYHNGDGPPHSIEHLPGHKQYGDKVNNGDHEPFDINHLSGKIVKPKPLPDVGVKFKSWLKLVTKPDEMTPPDTAAKRNAIPYRQSVI